MTDTIGAPSEVDWTNVDGKSYVTAVKNQGGCGSCWAFSTTGSLESRAAIKQGVTDSDIPLLSEQELVDCSKSEGNEGCNGGLMDDAFEYIEKAGGLCSESEYPYTGKTGRICKASECRTKYAAITGYTDVTKDSEPDLETAVAAGPVSIAVDAAGLTWQFYSGGVVTRTCGSKLDHGVLAVGYGAESDTKFWKVKNSWAGSSTVGASSPGLADPNWTTGFWPWATALRATPNSGKSRTRGVPHGERTGTFAFAESARPMAGRDSAAFWNSPRSRCRSEERARCHINE